MGVEKCVMYSIPHRSLRDTISASEGRTGRTFLSYEKATEPDFLFGELGTAVCFTADLTDAVALESFRP